MRSVALNGLCVLLSLAAVCAICEGALRFFHPRYDHAAEARREPDGQRIWKPSPNSHYRRSHPDAGRLHRVMHNNLGARNHRDIALESAVNLAFFGDSFTKNIGLPVQYSFHDVLDFLLNTPNVASGLSHRFNVLNFGVDAYGPGQAYIHYRSLPVKASFNHVFYTFCWNDIGDVISKGIYSLDNAGNLLEHTPPKTPVHVRVLARLHLTYLAMDGWERLRREWLERFEHKQQSDDYRRGVVGVPSVGGGGESDAIRLWRAVVLRWQREVESAGGKFTVVGLPVGPVWRGLASLPDSVETLSLADCFRNRVPDPLPERLLQFENDAHWNEAANMLAAHCLYRFLEQRLDLPPASDEALARKRHRYYHAFAEAPDWEGERWMPDPPWVLPSAVPRGAGVTIVEKYLALERSPARLDEYWRRTVRSAQARGPLVRAAWDVYAAWDQRLLVYVKKPCRDEDMKPKFFIHLYPAYRDEKAAPSGLASGHSDPSAEFADMRAFFTIWKESDECAVGFHLPDGGISRARTGQLIRHMTEDGSSHLQNVWTAELPLRKYPD